MKKTMKKVLALLLCLAALLSLAACGKDAEESAQSPETTVAQQTTQPEETTQPTETTTQPEETTEPSTDGEEMTKNYAMASSEETYLLYSLRYLPDTDAVTLVAGEISVAKDDPEYEDMVKDMQTQQERVAGMELASMEFTETETCAKLLFAFITTEGDPQVAKVLEEDFDIVLDGNYVKFSDNEKMLLDAGFQEVEE